MISTGMEICSKRPFQISDEKHFLRRLPQRLQSEFVSIYKQKSKNDSILPRIHRFWIESDDYIFVDVDYTQSQITYRLGNVKMSVKNHRMKYNVDGKLIDDETDNYLDNSPEDVFAKLFTNNYDEIGSYFPELLRLKELIKIGMLIRCVRSAYENLKADINDNDTKAIESAVRSLKDQAGDYPTETNDNIDKYYNEILIKNSVSDEDLTSSQIEDIKSNVRKQLVDADKTFVDKITTIICEGCHSVESHQTRAYVKNWLAEGKEPFFPSSKYEEKLIRFMAASFKKHKRAKYLNILTKIENLVDVRNEPSDSYLGNLKTECCWVPSVFGYEEKSVVRVYGGVSLITNPRKGTLPINDGKDIRRYTSDQVLGPSGRTTSKKGRIMPKKHITDTNRPSYTNPGHHDPDSRKFRRDGHTDPLPDDAETLYKYSVTLDSNELKNTWWSLNPINGDIYRYHSDGREAHYAGRYYLDMKRFRKLKSKSSQFTYKITKQVEIPSEIKKYFEKEWKIKQNEKSTQN